jgi:hypothetical protein
VKLRTVASAVGLGLCVGIGATVFVIWGGRFGGQEYQGWQGDPRLGSPAADPWRRAQLAAFGLLALNKSESIYFTRSNDEFGKPMDPSCIYRIEGTELPARWWSITLYDEDGYLARNDDNASSIDGSRISADASGRWSALIGPGRRDAADWLSSRATKRFNLTLRFYNPSPEAVADFDSIQLPKIERMACEAGR